MPEIIAMDIDAADVKRGDRALVKGTFVSVTDVDTKTSRIHLTIVDDGGNGRKRSLPLSETVSVRRSVLTPDEEAARRREFVELDLLDLIKSSLNAVFDGRRQMEAAANDTSATYQIKWGLSVVDAEAKWSIVGVIPSLVWEGRYDLLGAAVVVYEETMKDVLRGAANGTHRSSSEWSNVVESVGLSAKADLLDRLRHRIETAREFADLTA